MPIGNLFNRVEIVRLDRSFRGCNIPCHKMLRSVPVRGESREGVDRHRPNLPEIGKEGQIVIPKAGSLDYALISRAHDSPAHPGNPRTKSNWSIL